MTRENQEIFKYFLTHKEEEDDGSVGAVFWFKTRGVVRMMAGLMAIVVFGILLTVAVAAASAWLN